MSWTTHFDGETVDVRDPSPWLTLFLDQSSPVAPNTKRALLSGQDTASRRLLLPLVRPFARLGIVAVQLLRIVIPESWNSSRLLHQTIYLGLRWFVRPEANYLILRHFNIGTELLRFVADNLGVTITRTTPLRPLTLEDLKNDTFLIHDLNVFNFFLELNERLRERGQDEVAPPATIDYSAITDGEFDFGPLPDGALNFVDLQTAIELYTPLYALFLSDRDFWRASNSLQLDEIVATYVSKLLLDPMPLAMVNNRHPMVPISTLMAGFRLMLHGLDAETLHGHLRLAKRRAAGQTR
jgi:hypothetical protein